MMEDELIRVVTKEYIHEEMKEIVKNNCAEDTTEKEKEIISNIVMCFITQKKKNEPEIGEDE